MPVRRWLGCAALACLAVIAGCRDFTGPNSSAQKKPTSPVGASFSRYILISGVWTCVENCDDQGGGGSGGDQGGGDTPKAEGLPTTTPIIPIDSIGGISIDPIGGN
jgi:hypothetical protein